VWIQVRAFVIKDLLRFGAPEARDESFAKETASSVTTV
jgi:hypothetical protein